MKKNVKNEEKSFSTINLKSFIFVTTILIAILILCGCLTLFIPQGSFLRNDNGEIIAGTYTKGDVKGLAFWRILTAPVRVFFAEGSITIIMICLFLLIMSGVFNLLDKTNGIKVLMNKMMIKFGKRRKLVLCIGILFFMLFGSLFGMFEELVTLLPFVTIFALCLGYDSMTGLGICLLSSCFGFSAAITNPFSIGIASSLAGISTLSGVWVRILFFIIIYGIVCTFILLHTKRIEKDPKKSLSFDVDQEKRQKLNFNLTENKANDNKVFKVYLTFFIIQFIILALVAIVRPISGFAVPILAASFLIGGIICGMLVVDKKSDVFKYILKGAVSMLPAILLIALASSVNLVMQESGILDTIMNSVINFLSGKSPFVSILLIYALILILQLFIGSASAKIFLIMPILLPICSAIGISPTLLILTYCMADGFSDVILPTNPVLLISLSMSNISYGKWVKWTWKIQSIVLAISLLVLWICIQLGF